MYFEHSIPRQMPKYMLEHNKEAWAKMYQTVNGRMNLLEDALQKSGLRGEDFAASVSAFFDPSQADPALDHMTAEQIAEIAKLHAPLVGRQPDRMVWPNADVVVDTAFTTTKEWEMIRSIGLGGSEAAVVLGCSPYNTTQALYHLKVGTKMKWEPADNGKQFIFAYGHCVESLVIDTFCNRSGATIIPETRMFRHRKYPWVTANMDGVVMMPATAQFPNGRIFILEAKTTTSQNQNAWYEQKIPKQYVPQCRQYMAVMNDPRIHGTYIACIWGNTPDCFSAKLVERDMLLEEMQLDEEAAFWKDHILMHKDPGPSGKPDKDTEMIRKLTGPADKQEPTMDLDPALAVQFEKAAALNKEISALKKIVEAKTTERDNLMTPVKDAMGTCTAARVEGKDKTWSVKWTPAKKTKTDMEKLALTYPDVFADVVSLEAEGSRRFSFK